MRMNCHSALILISILSIGEVPVNGQVRSCPNPGYRSLGIYGGGTASYIDYQAAKISLENTFPHKREFWAALKASKESPNTEPPSEVYLISCGERRDSFEVVKRRVDAWLASEPKAPTYPDLIPAVCIGEENTPDRDEVLDALARHIRETYRIPVFQWYSDPLPPSTNLTADGWIWDSYGADEVRFRRHLQKFVALGKPAICVPWASDPHWPQWKQYPTADALINGEWHQFRVCCEFNVSCAVFAVGGPGSVYSWLGSPAKEMVSLRNWLRVKRQEMHSYAPGQLPMPSANFSARARSPQAGGDPGSPSRYDEDFTGFDWIHDANIEGFLDLRLTSRPDKPGFLLGRTEAGQQLGTSLVYRFESYFPLESVKIVLDAAAPAEARCRNVLALKTDEVSLEWPLQVDQQGNGEVRPLELRDAELVKNQRVFYVRVGMENHASGNGQPGNRLDHLRVECVHQPPPKGEVAKLVADEYGNVAYEDDFETDRWRHLGELTVGHEKRGGYLNKGFWVGGAAGGAISTHVMQRVSAEKPLKQLAVEANCYANGPNLGGSISLQIAPRGGKPKWEVVSQGLHQGLLRLDVPSEDLRDLTDFDVHLSLRSNSGVDSGERPCATVDGIRVFGK